MNNGQGGIHAVASQPAPDTAVVTAWRRSAIFARGMLHARSQPPHEAPGPDMRRAWSTR
jgi:hypothetical protein